MGLDGAALSQEGTESVNKGRGYCNACASFDNRGAEVREYGATSS
jgi:hypothetical protein